MHTLCTHYTPWPFKVKPLSPEQRTDRQRIRDTMLRMLARREHSEAEVRQKMQMRGFDMCIVQTELADFQQRNWQNDIRFTEQFVRQRIARGQGEVRIRYELRMQQISDELINAAIGEQDVDWFELAKQTHDRRFGEPGSLTLKQKQQHQRLLQSKGFTSDQIQFACPCKYHR